MSYELKFEFAPIREHSFLRDLIKEPRETLDVEIKEWLDLGDKYSNHRAKLAKAIIALANHGGGYIVIGFEELADGAFTPALPRPENLDNWSQDEIQSIITRYIDPSIQCRVIHYSPTTPEAKYPVIVVPGGHRVLVRAKAASRDGKELVPHRVYIRKPGPCSEEPKSAEEWDRLFERCLHNRKAELLEAMRSIMAGELPTAAPRPSTRLDQLTAFEQQAISRWEGRVASLPKDAPPRLPLGCHDIAVAIDGRFERKSLPELRNIILSEVRSHSTWPPFLTINRPPFLPKPMDGAVECWIGPDADGAYDKPSHHDFWRVSPDGFFFTRRGYQEDAGYDSKAPGQFFDVAASSWRLGEAILEVMYIARAMMANDADLILHCQWTGLAGRTLTSFDQRRMMWDVRSIAQGRYEAKETVALSALPDVLPELVFAILSPLYELFDFFKLPKRLVEEELAMLQKRQL